ncbi:MAG: hypothetical protein ACOX0M_08920 [Salinivirgaceae bacterium]|jgi:hypothetical protein|nr:hypothetical protein [Bacteroidales bacterium]
MRLTIVWVISIIFTLIIIVYQKTTGPTYPLKVTYEETKIKLPRSSTTDKDCKIVISESVKFDNAYLLWKYYPGTYNYDTLQFTLKDSIWEAILPTQPSAGKLEYHIILTQNSETVFDTKDQPAIIRFKDSVPALVLIPHIILMFSASLLSIVALFMIILKKGNYRLIARLTLIALTAGGLIFGPIVQKFAFGQYWTGFPLGYDLTDNKTLIAFILWSIAVALNIKKSRKWLIVLATISTLVINSIPHSTRGSELNRETGKIETSK